jgi:hypothetical protein
MDLRRTLSLEQRAKTELHHGAIIGAVIGVLSTFAFVGMLGGIGGPVMTLIVIAVGGIFEAAFVGGLSYALVKRKGIQRLRGPARLYESPRLAFVLPTRANHALTIIGNCRY